MPRCLVERGAYFPQTRQEIEETGKRALDFSGFPSRHRLAGTVFQKQQCLYKWKGHVDTHIKPVLCHEMVPSSFSFNVRQQEKVIYSSCT